MHRYIYDVTSEKKIKNNNTAAKTKKLSSAPCVGIIYTTVSSRSVAHRQTRRSVDYIIIIIIVIFVTTILYYCVAVVEFF